MTTEMGGAQTGDQGGASGNQNVNSVNGDKIVKFEDHKRAIDDMLGYKKKVGDLSSTLDAVQQELNSLKEEKLKGASDYKTLWEKEKQRADELDGRNKTIVGNVMYDQKYKAAQSALMKAGLRPDAMKILERDELTDIVVEQTSGGRFLVNGLETFVENFKKEFPFAFQTTPAPNVNGGGGYGSNSVDTSTVTPSMVVEAERESNKDVKNKEKRDRYLSYLKRYNEQKMKK